MSIKSDLTASTIYDRYAELLKQRPQHLATISNQPLCLTAAAQLQFYTAA
jgi:hypothetical protein